MKNKCFKILICAVLMLLLASISALTVFAAGDVAVQHTFSQRAVMIETIQETGQNRHGVQQNLKFKP